MADKTMTKKELQEFVDLLIARKRLLMGDVSHMEDEALKKNGDSELSTLPMHMADLGTDSNEQDITLGLMENESDELQEIEEALERIKDGSFGLCEGCKKRIPKSRLQAIPYTRLCVECKRKEEGA